jgi:hypothetical protein
MSIVKIAATKRKDYGAEGAIGVGTAIAIAAALRSKNNPVGSAILAGIPGVGLGYTAGSMIKRNKLKQEFKKTLHKKLSEFRREHEP